MSYSLNYLKGDHFGDNVGEYYRRSEGDAPSLDYCSHGH